jgi:microcystin-dependent protein
MLSTPRLGIAYPQGSDTAVVPRDVFAVADYIDDNVTIYGAGTLATRPAATLAGRFYYATDTGILFFATGTDWIPLNETIAAVPIGAILDFAGGTVPTNYRLCVGTSMLIADYNDLWLQLGAKYGQEDGSHFSLPDYRGRVAVMQDRGANRLNIAASPANDRGKAGGIDEYKLSGAQSGVAAHTHTGSTGDGIEMGTGVVPPRINVTPTTAGLVGSNNASAPYLGAPLSWFPLDFNSLRVASHNHAVTINTVSAAIATQDHDNTMPWLTCDKIIKVL